MLTKKYWFILFLLFHLTFVCIGQKIVRLDKTKISENNLDVKNETLMKTAYPNGLAVAIFRS